MHGGEQHFLINCQSCDSLKSELNSLLQNQTLHVATCSDSKTTLALAFQWRRYLNFMLSTRDDCSIRLSQLIIIGENFEFQNELGLTTTNGSKR